MSQPHPHCPKHGQRSASSTSDLTALGLMIPVLNKWLTESVEPAVDCADALIETLLRHGYDITCKTCGQSWTAYCGCRKARVANAD